MADKAKKPQEIEVRSIRVNRASIRCEWKLGDDEYAVTFHDNPLPSLQKALDELKPHVCTLSEFPAKDEEKITVTGLTINHKGDNPMATIVAKKTLKRNKRVLNVATPILSLYENAENESADHMTDEEAGAVERLIKEAKKYIVGERAQGKLALGDEDKKPKGKSGDENTVPFPEMTEAANG